MLKQALLHPNIKRMAPGPSHPSTQTPDKTSSAPGRIGFLLPTMKTNPSATIHISSEAKRALDEALPVLLNLLKHREQAALEPLNTIE